MMLHVCAHAAVSMKIGMKMNSLIRVVRNFVDGELTEKGGLPGGWCAWMGGVVNLCWWCKGYETW
jgi:hypothetical protein